MPEFKRFIKDPEYVEAFEAESTLVMRVSAGDIRVLPGQWVVYERGKEPTVLDQDVFKKIYVPVDKDMKQ